MRTWEELKLEGSGHYKTGTTEPIDLYKAKGVFKYYALTSIIKYATRNLELDINPKDFIKIIHLAELVLAEQKEKDLKNLEERGKE